MTLADRLPSITEFSAVILHSFSISRLPAKSAAAHFAA